MMSIASVSARFRLPQGGWLGDFNTDKVFTLNDLPDFEFAIKFSGLYTPDANWFVEL